MRILSLVLPFRITLKAYKIHTNSLVRSISQAILPVFVACKGTPAAPRPQVLMRRNLPSSSPPSQRCDRRIKSRSGCEFGGPRKDYPPPHLGVQSRCKSLTELGRMSYQDTFEQISSCRNTKRKYCSQKLKVPVLFRS